MSSRIATLAVVRGEIPRYRALLGGPARNDEFTRDREQRRARELAFPEVERACMHSRAAKQGEIDNYIGRRDDGGGREDTRTTREALPAWPRVACSPCLTPSLARCLGLIRPFLRSRIGRRWWLTSGARLPNLGGSAGIRWLHYSRMLPSTCKRFASTR